MLRVFKIRTQFPVILFAVLLIFSSCKSENDTDRMRSDKDNDNDNSDMGKDKTMAGGSMAQSIQAAMNNMKEKIGGYNITGDPDYDFAMIMMPHHQAAIDMGQVYLNDGANPKLKDMVSNDVAKQKQEIGEIKDWMARQNNFSPGNIDENYKNRIDKVIADVKGMNTQSVTNNSDLTYINSMIPHHQAAIDLAKIEQQYGKINSMKNLANKIIAEQQDGIKMMQDMRTEVMSK